MSEFRLFRHAVLMLIENLSAALKISVLPIVAAGALTFLALLPFVDFDKSGGENFNPIVVLIILCGALLYLIAIVWVAVGWHRFVLLEESPGPAWPIWNGASVRAYIGAFIRMIPLSILLGFIVLLVFMIPAAIFRDGNVSTNDGTLLGFFLGVAISYVTLRISLVLPAAAIGEFMRVPDSWSRTGKHIKTIFATALCIGVLTAIPNLLLSTPLAPLLQSFAYTVFAQWFLTMLGVSIATAMYGHIVEDRPLR